MISPIQKSQPKIYFKRTQDNRIINKVASASGSIIGLSVSLALLAKRHRVNFVDTFKKIEFDEKDVIGLALASIGGGFAGGVITDFKNKKHKAKESIIQLFGNYIIPSLFVGAGVRANKALNKRYKFPPITKSVQFFSGAISLVAGVLLGNKVAKKLNEKMFDEDNNRALNWKDWALQFDNVCLVTSMSTAGTNLSQIASRIIPFALFMPGYLVGTKTNDKN